MGILRMGCAAVFVGIAWAFLGLLVVVAAPGKNPYIILAGAFVGAAASLVYLISKEFDDVQSP